MAWKCEFPSVKMHRGNTQRFYWTSTMQSYDDSTVGLLLYPGKCPNLEHASRDSRLVCGWNARRGHGTGSGLERDTYRNLPSPPI
jgi:hypothetical protein